MSGREQAEKLWSSILGLGARRLTALAIVGITVLAAVGIGSYYLSKPEREVLYSGLSRDDIGRMGAALNDVGISFDVSADGESLLVAHAETARARMLLAEKGLPQSSNSGYELFNEIGSFGLTSFMQEVTRTRALEGELARSIQTMAGVKAARVHLVLTDRASFRADQHPASASVIVRTENPNDPSGAQAIRHLVAAAVPGLELDDVTVLNTEGMVLASGDDGSGAAASKNALLEQQVSGDLEQKIRRTLAPYLGVGNYQVSVTSRLNMDRTTVNETIFDPEKRVERSVRVVKENANAQNSSAAAAASVAQNLPAQATGADSGKNSNEENERREETTNFEISSKTIATEHDGFDIEILSIAILVNQDRLAELAGQGDNPKSVDQQLMDIEQLASSAAGFDKDRGDQLKVSAVSFVKTDLEPVPSPGIFDLLIRQAGTMVNALAIVVVAVLLIWFGLRPTVRAILARPAESSAVAMIPPSEPTVIEAAAAAHAAQVSEAAGAGPAGSASSADKVNLIEDLTSKLNRSPQKRLEQIVDFDEEQAAAILRQWLHQENA